MLRHAARVAARRCFAADAAPAVRVDFSELATRVNGDDAKREMLSLKKLTDDMRETLAAAAKTPEPIDFAYYRKQLNAPGVVDAFEKAYAGLKVPAYAGKEAEALAAAFASLDKEAAAAESAARKRISELEAELTALAAEKEKLKTVTLDEVLAAEPGLAAKVDADIKADKWY